MNAGKYRTAATFFKVTVCLVTGDIFVATLAVRQQGNSIALSAATDEKSGLVSKVFSSSLLQGQNGGILPVDVVTDLGLEHGLSHACTWLRGGIASKIN